MQIKLTPVLSPEPHEIDRFFKIEVGPLKEGSFYSLKPLCFSYTKEKDR
ncbi:MAG: hypothetical protein R6U96_09330 [Promethearchaeia archaeon]